MAHVIGIDIGTTAIKAAIFDADGRLSGSHTQEYDLLTPAPGSWSWMRPPMSLPSRQRSPGRFRTRA
ncbi:FGGY family carbohydrate kinase [Gemmobacter lanyuensis]